MTCLTARRLTEIPKEVRYPLAIEPAGGMVYLEGRATDGAQVALYVSPVALRGSSLAARHHVSIVQDLHAATSTAPPPLRERMARSAVAGASATERAAGSATPRATTTAAPLRRLYRAIYRLPRGSSTNSRSLAPTGPMRDCSPSSPASTSATASC